jgi:hypothetical protein
VAEEVAAEEVAAVEVGVMVKASLVEITLGAPGVAVETTTLVAVAEEAAKAAGVLSEAGLPAMSTTVISMPHIMKATRIT